MKGKQGAVQGAVATVLLILRQDNFQLLKNESHLFSFHHSHLLFH